MKKLGSHAAMRARKMRSALFRTMAMFACLFLTLTAMAATNVIQITYDAAGNITNIARQTGGGFAITGFDPASAPVGVAVTIYGTGFDSVPANNVVSFNGVTAVVASSAPGSISTTVPNGATTGRITVTIGSVSATSGQDFVVTIPGAPVISSFTPVTGAASTVVSVSGSAFDAGTTVKLNGVTAPATVASPNAISFTVPAATASGRIAATNSVGTGVSAQDFIVPPAGIAASDIVSATRVSSGGAAGSVSIGTQNKSALILFDATLGGYYTMQFRQIAVNPTTAAVNYKVIRPDNTVVSTGVLTGSNGRPSINVPKISMAGTYSVLVSPGAATFNATASLSPDPQIEVDGAAVVASMDTAGQRLRFLVNASLGQKLGIGIFNHSVVGSGNTAFDAYRPDGQSLGNLVNCGPTDSTCDAEFAAPIGGIYELIVYGIYGGKASFSLQASNEITATLPPDAVVPITIGRVGQDARLTFALNAGDSAGIGFFTTAFAVQNQSVSFTVYKPDGTQYLSQSVSTGGGYLELGTVPASGTYTLVLDPSKGDYGSFSIALQQGALIGTSDAPLAWTSMAPGAVSRLRFNASAGQNLSFAVAGLAYATQSSSSVNLAVNGPGRNQVAYVNSCSPTQKFATCKVSLPNLAAGTYSVVIAPGAPVAVSGNAVLSQDLTGTLTNGVQQTISAARAGQNARYTFSGTAGDSTSFKLLGAATTPSGSRLNITIFMPNGSTATGSTANLASPLVNLASLPVTGTYTALIEPADGVTWQTGAMVDPGQLMEINGATGTLSTSIAGEQLRFRFAGTAGQVPQLGVSGITIGSGSGYFVTRLYRPDGGQLGTDIYCNQGGPYCGDPSPALPALPTTGTYAVVVDTYSKSLTGGNVYISTPLTGSLNVGDPAQMVVLDRPGRTARYTFAGTSAQALRLNWANTSVTGTGSVAVTVLKPDGSTLNSASFATAATGGVDLAALPSTGTYTVVLDPSTVSTATADISVATR